MGERGFDLFGGMRPSRRGFLAGGLAAMTAACAPREASGFFPPSGPAIGVQLYSVGPEAAADLDGTLGKLAAIGYRTVELAGYIGRTPTELRAALDRAGLKCTSAHVPGLPFRPAPRTLDDDPGLLAEEARILGFDTVIMPLFVTPPHLPIRLNPGDDVKKVVTAIVAKMGEDGWKWCADYMNRKAAGLSKHGLKFGFHNHGNEFGPVGNRSIMELLIAETDPALVSFQLDCGWAAGTGTDPAAFIRRHKGRVSALHIKDVVKSNVPNFELRMDHAEVGKGIIDWRDVMAASREAGITRFFVEQEAPHLRPVFDVLKSNHDYLAAL
ncbi:sugar phosphate isomerase/epimerase [Sphingomonas sp. MG17]|uniref:Sugar phosphate isomerase/epimerase n=1 Tax=Sphingomonas tagetis TaxID=2949092 RepID=A0A9X2HJ75_9SPHN|nr:sugar phosphate isomerase/epimerase [Sphingomonas tagetis]MCP3731012.1 sugar phosphate isomerase/epimerase [Sphingomonas tagetis]